MCKVNKIQLGHSLNYNELISYVTLFVRMACSNQSIIQAGELVRQQRVLTDIFDLGDRLFTQMGCS
jgi:hypothetical protein